ncbi:MAG: hypothetical protein E7457_02890 [Ruminococcaceae bacterium]|nr:hypothetical protein [Oscillospiraceae bacterium]
MFAVGELVVYGGEGVCRVERIGIPDIRGVDREYYTLAPLYRTGQVMTPVDTKVLMRPVLSRRQAEELIAELPQLKPGEVQNHVRAIKEYYQNIVASYDCRQLAQLIKLTEQKRQQAAKQGKKVSQLDERYLHRAEELLYGELAVALEMPREQVPDYLQQVSPRWEITDHE